MWDRVEKRAAEIGLPPSVLVVLIVDYVLGGDDLARLALPLAKLADVLSAPRVRRLQQRMTR
jgi:hypothetical protein